jgi:LPS-assembly protein
LNKKYSNIFGSVDHSISNFLQLGYDFSINNDLDQVDYSALDINISINNFVTKFNFIEENNIMGNESSVENITSYTLDEKIFYHLKQEEIEKSTLQNIMI